jgi:hypothetical protein
VEPVAEPGAEAAVEAVAEPAAEQAAKFTVDKSVDIVEFGYSVDGEDHCVEVSFGFWK